MSRRVLLTFVLFPFLAVLAACSGGSDVAPEQPDMSGFFMLNEDESDDPTQLVGMPGRPGGSAVAERATPEWPCGSSRPIRH